MLGGNRLPHDHHGGDHVNLRQARDGRARGRRDEGRTQPDAAHRGPPRPVRREARPSPGGASRFARKLTRTQETAAGHRAPEVFRTLRRAHRVQGGGPQQGRQSAPATAVTATAPRAVRPREPGRCPAAASYRAAVRRDNFLVRCSCSESLRQVRRRESSSPRSSSRSPFSPSSPGSSGDPPIATGGRTADNEDREAVGVFVANRLAARLLTRRRIDPVTGCWLWQGRRDHWGTAESRSPTGDGQSTDSPPTSTSASKLEAACTSFTAATTRPVSGPTTSTSARTPTTSTTGYEDEIDHHPEIGARHHAPAGVTPWKDSGLQPSHPAPPARAAAAG